MKDINSKRKTLILEKVNGRQKIKTLKMSKRHGTRRRRVKPIRC